MKILIDISENDYYKTKLLVQMGIGTKIDNIVMNGKLLPKGHGRLIDADALNRKDINCAGTPMNFIDIAPTIIEADIETEEVDEDDT